MNRQSTVHTRIYGTICRNSVDVWLTRAKELSVFLLCLYGINTMLRSCKVSFNNLTIASKIAYA